MCVCVGVFWIKRLKMLEEGECICNVQDKNEENKDVDKAKR